MTSLKKRGKTYYAHYYLGGKQKRVSLGTSSLQIAKGKIRQIESALARVPDIPLPTKTPIAEVVAAYCEYLHTVKTPRNTQRDNYNLWATFGQVCPTHKIKSDKSSEKRKKRPCRPPPSPSMKSQPLRTDFHRRYCPTHRRLSPQQGTSPKPANRFRVMLTRLCNWATQQHSIRTH